jgi:hypothetical protein
MKHKIIPLVVCYLLVLYPVRLPAQDMQIWMGRNTILITKTKRVELAYCKILDYDGTFRYVWLKDKSGKLVAWGPLDPIESGVAVQSGTLATTTFFKFKFIESPNGFEVSRDAYALITSTHLETQDANGKTLSSNSSFKMQVGRSNGNRQTFDPVMEVSSGPGTTTVIPLGEIQLNR